MRKIVYWLALLGFAVVMSIVPGTGVRAGAGSLILDFENGVPYGVDANGNGLGLVPWGSTFENVTLSARQVLPGSALDLPTSEGNANTVLAVAYDIAANGWGGFSYAFTDGQNWTSADWSNM